MKKTKKRSLNISLAILFTSSVLFLTACSQDDAESTSNTEELVAVETVENALKMSTNGMTNSMKTIIVYADDQFLETENPTMDCNQSYSDSYAENYASTNFSFNYSAAASYQLVCDSNGNTQSLSCDVNRQGSYETPRMYSDDSNESNWNVNFLNSDSEMAVFNGLYVRNGSQISKVRNQNTYISTLTFNTENVVVNKTTYMVESGSASISYQGVATNGNQYTFEGELTFNGNNSATLVLNGNIYILSL